MPGLVPSISGLFLTGIMSDNIFLILTEMRKATGV